MHIEEVRKFDSLKPEKVVDLREAICPHPLNVIRDTLRDLGDKAVLLAVSDHEPTALENAPRFCERRGYPYRVVEQEGIWNIFIQKIEEKEPRLKVENVSKIFNTGHGKVSALSDINLTIRDGEFVSIVGSSGCGKSTLLNLIAGLDRPSKGQILANGKRVDGPGSDRVVVFQEGALFPWLTVTENVEFGLKLRRVARKIRRELAYDYLKLIGLDDKFHNSYIHQLSGGMKQRVALARALVMEPSILLMDEPFAALDIQTRESLQEELQRIWVESHKTIIFVTHNVEEAVILGDRVLVFTKNPGRIKSEHDIEIERPRKPGNPEVFLNTKWITDEIREEGEDSEAGIREAAG
jgi:NitT/TauT family transport system ATP-binding protein